MADKNSQRLRTMSCSECRLSKLCLPMTLRSEEVPRLDKIIRRGHVLQKGDHLYRANDPFSAIYAIRSGYIKTYRITDDGQEQVTGFYFPGEVFGMDGLTKNRYLSSARALESTAICEIPFTQFQKLTAQLPSLQMHFFQIMSREITTDQQFILLLNKKTAIERVATLLLIISARYVNLRLSGTTFRLVMSRTDISNYLGLTVETISRTLSTFHKQGVIDIDNREMTILDFDILRTTANLER